jgi:Sec-independent protein translocase protein TatA
MISLGQILVVLLIALLFFGDLPSVIRKFTALIKGSQKLPKKY